VVLLFQPVLLSNLHVAGRAQQSISSCLHALCSHVASDQGSSIWASPLRQQVSQRRSIPKGD